MQTLEKTPETTAEVASAALAVSALTKEYPRPDGSQLVVLHPTTFSLQSGTTCAIVGPSGSGKTTLLGLLAGLDQPSAGSVQLLGQNLTGLSENELAAFRNKHVGFVFQNFQLIPTLTALENVMVPLELRGERKVAGRAKEWLARVGLADRAEHYPLQLSGGEQQRIALARAFVTRPELLFADEPTGNLDAETSETITSLLFELNKEAGTTLLLSTHDLELARQMQRVIKLAGGKIVDDGLAA